MSPLTYVKIGVVVLLLGLFGYTYTLHKDFAAQKAVLAEKQAQLVAVTAAKEKSEKAALDLQVKMNALEQQKQVTITKLVKVPVSPDETCVSEVLKESLRD